MINKKRTHERLVAQAIFVFLVACIFHDHFGKHGMHVRQKRSKRHRLEEKKKKRTKRRRSNSSGSDK
jgi:hypothetical protein